MELKKIIKGWLKASLSAHQIENIRWLKSYFPRLVAFYMYPYARYFKTPINKIRNSKKSERRLEIGPGPVRIEGFETLNVVWGKNVDYIGDVTKSLSFDDETFDIIFASHVLEHIPWHQLSKVINEWVRVVKKGGSIEIWIPDGYKLAKFIVEIEEGKARTEWNDGWRPFNPDNDPYLWGNGRLLYGVRPDYPSWHRAVITPKMLESILLEAGIKNIQRLHSRETRGYDHGWINLGMRGIKE